MQNGVYAVSHFLNLFIYAWLDLSRLVCDVSHTVLSYTYHEAKGKNSQGMKAFVGNAKESTRKNRFPEKGESPWAIPKKARFGNRAPLLRRRSHFLLRRWGAPNRIQPQWCFTMPRTFWAPPGVDMVLPTSSILHFFLAEFLVTNNRTNSS